MISRGFSCILGLSFSCLAGYAMAERVSSPVAASASPVLSREATPPRAAVTVIEVTLGRRDENDKGLFVRQRDVFAPDDSIALSILTRTADDTATITDLHVLWTYDHRGERMVVKGDRRVSVTQGLTNTVFEIAKPDGFPTGRYHVEVMLREVVVEHLEFSVRR